MRIRKKFILTYAWGAILIFFGSGLLIGALIAIWDANIPLDDMPEGLAMIVVLSSTFIPILIGGGLLGIWLVEPVLQVMMMLRKLSKGDYDLTEQLMNLYQRGNRHKLKRRYRLYEDVLKDLSSLSDYLIKTERERAVQEENKKNWIAGVSHDLKTPLSYITGYAQVLLINGYDLEDAQRRKFIQSIYDKGVTIGELITDLNLSFKMDDFKEALPLLRSEFDFVDFMRRLIADIINDPRAAGYEIGFQCDIAQINMNADKRLMQRAFQNIIMNAVLHNPQGTVIDISIEATAEGRTKIVIEDNGHGMDADAIKQLFIRYYRNAVRDDTNFGGGLGMSVAKNIIEAHGGAIYVTSEISRGTRFVILV